MKTSESIKTISKALVKAQSEMASPKKDAKNPFFKSTYTDLNSILEVAIPALNANGICVLQPLVREDGKDLVETVLLHESGEFLSSLTEIVSGKPNDPQAKGSGITYARRYALKPFLGLGDTDDDGEAAMCRDVSPKLLAKTEVKESKPIPTFSKKKDTEAKTDKEREW